VPVRPVRIGRGLVTARVVFGALMALASLGEEPFYAAVLAAVGLGVVLAVNRPTWRPAMYGVLVGVPCTFVVLMVAVAQF
jgi:hypothetical protein